MVSIWSKIPLFRLIFPFIAGILLACSGIGLPLPAHWLLLMSFTGLSFIVIAFNPGYRWSWLSGICIHLALFSLGHHLCAEKTEHAQAAREVLRQGSYEEVHARLAQPFLRKETSVRTVLELLAVKREGRWRKISVRVLAYFPPETLTGDLRYGDELVLCGRFREIPGPLNPEEFDYRHFLSTQDIHLQAFLKAGQWRPTGRNSGNPIRALCIEWRDQLLERMRSQNIKEEEFAVGAALLLGYCDMLSPETIASYSATGAMHVLSVSGLHVGIVYLVFSWMLLFMERFRHGKMLRVVLLILLLWLYAALTGLSPSVLRAATMLSFVIIGRSLRRSANVYNTLAASAFLLLLTDPFLIMNVGFQLSYVAVIGILYLQPGISLLFDPPQWIGEQLWTLTSVSIAAQIATFPLGLFYFHQFPNYFLITNMVVIPLSTAVIYMGISFFAFSAVPVAGAWVAAGFSASVWLLNFCVARIDALPWAVSSGISISGAETILIYACIIFACAYFTLRKYLLLNAALLCIIILLGAQIAEQLRQDQQKELIIYHLPKGMAIDLIQGRKNVLLHRSNNRPTSRSIHRQISPHWWARGIQETAMPRGDTITERCSIQGRYILFEGLKLLLLQEEQQLRNRRAESRLKLDVLILTGDPRVSVHEILRLYAPGLIVFDASNAPYRIAGWKEACGRMGQEYYSIPDQGAFMLEPSGKYRSSHHPGK